MIKELFKFFSAITFSHVYREENQEADFFIKKGPHCAPMIHNIKSVGIWSRRTMALFKVVLVVFLVGTICVNTCMKVVFCIFCTYERQKLLFEKVLSSVWTVYQASFFKGF
jgi:hypothetical protein